MAFKSDKTFSKSKSYYTTNNAIGVSTWNGKGKYGYSTRYIPKTPENIKKITAIKGKPEKDGNKLIWM